MTDRNPHTVLYLMGACAFADDDDIDEVRIMQAEVAALRSNGHDVITMGTPEEGFTLDDIAHAMRTHEDIRTIIINAHGGFDEDGNHFTPTHIEQSDPYTVDLYRVLAEGANHPLTVLSFSCGSTHTIADAKTILPIGSTLVTFARRAPGPFSYHLTKPEETGICRTIDPEAFAVPADADNFAETLFIRLMCYDTSRNHACVTVVKGSKRASKSHDFPLAVLETLCNAKTGKILTKEKAFLNRALRDCAHPKDRKFVFSTIENVASIGQTLSHGVSAATLVPRAVGFDALQEEMFAKMESTGRFGLLCAMNYLLVRKKIGAFGSQPSAFYLEPAKPAMLGTAVRLLGLSYQD